MKIFTKCSVFLFSSILLTINIDAQCPYDNAGYLEGDAPATVGYSVIAEQTWGGEFNRFNNMQAGYTYEVSTCNSATFDSELTIYPAFGGNWLAYDDDGCGEIAGASKILFTPTNTGDYDILLDEYDCIDNEIDMTMTVKLISTSGGGGGGGGDPTVSYIPVVVHVIYENANENISDAQINSQINVLNSDFRKLNADFSDAPSPFQLLGADLKIQFCLASEDPNGNATTGITRTSTNQDSFDYELNNDPKNTNDGGKDNWDPQHYLNLWVCDLSGTLLGYATFPSELANDPELDGVVISYKYFGDFNTDSPYDLGRTATHEVGHWLNLRHVWGDDYCGNDFVSDTPVQEEASGGCPSYPQTSCSNGPNGDLFVDYMDYSNDECLLLFTNGQKERTSGTLATFRAALPNSSGCGNVTELETREDNSIFKIFPNPTSKEFTIKLNESANFNTEFKIINLLGEELQNIKINRISDMEYLFDVSSISKGIYFFECITNTTKFINRLVIQ